MAGQRATKDGKATGGAKSAAAGRTTSGKGASRKGSSSKGSTSGGNSRKGSSGKNGAGKRAGQDDGGRMRGPEEGISPSMRDELVLAVTLLASILFFLSYIHLCGAVGEWLNYIIFGLVGIFGYLFPFLLFFGVAFGIANRKNRVAARKIACVLVFLVCVGSLLELVNGYDPELKWAGYFTASAEGKSGGGILGGTPVRLLCPLFDTVATAVILFAVMLVCLMLLTGRELFAYIGRRTRDTVREHRSSAAERAERRLVQEAEEFEDDGPSTRRARVITFQKGTAGAAEEPSETRDAAAARQTEKKSAAEEPIRFLDALKARGRKNEPAKQAQEQAEETGQSPIAVEIEEVTPEAEMVNITISGNYEREEKSFYEEELKRKFGEQQTNSAFGEYRGETPKQQAPPEETQERGHERTFYDVNVAEGTGVPLLVRTEWPDIVSIIEKKRREQQAAGNAAASGKDSGAGETSEPESVSEADSPVRETEAEGLRSGRETVAAGAALEPESVSGADSTVRETEAEGIGSGRETIAAGGALEPESGGAEDFFVRETGAGAMEFGRETIAAGGVLEPEFDSGAAAFDRENFDRENFDRENAHGSNALGQAGAAASRREPDSAGRTLSNSGRGSGDGFGGEDPAAFAADIANRMEQPEVEKKYEFPPIELLAEPKPGKGANERELKETAVKLQKTLESFGVRVTVTNICCGPSVTQYELQPEQGVKVSQITKLSDDIKLNLAAADIRIEAPIPGKAAVGIEVPNKENTAVILRELLESKEFTEHKSRVAFAVGKNISGQIIVSDIAKMPHMLIAGATGSGKSVCINTIIMSILYKADPKDVKLIMVDPKVVELSIYNGIPHLLIPVVTDPKKASAALNWAVMEMTDRYNKFAELGVRDLNGYNEKVAGFDEPNPAYPKLPQIVIIVDELADLMMVASANEVEDAICRLAQMARAAGLHLIIATQRPSVNVITGVIKANVPSRIAFAVTSAVDSRTILDGVGAERLLGKGDMLFFPSGYPKPVRIQGAFVSDSEVSAVVDFLKAQAEGAPGYNEEVQKRIMSSSPSDGGGGSADDKDDYFIEAGRFIIEKEKASIGMLQRLYKIGFNRAARIMDQLTAAGVVGPEEGTKPRKILMTMEEFEEKVANRQ